MHIVIWHANSCIRTCPDPIRASNDNKYFFSLYKDAGFYTMFFLFV